jgi:hypothetical protein
MKMSVFWIVAPCSLVEVYWRFGGICCLHHYGVECLPALQPRRRPSWNYFLFNLFKSKNISLKTSVS